MEYRVTRIVGGTVDIESHLNKLALDGWRVVGVTETFIILERPVQKGKE